MDERVIIERLIQFPDEGIVKVMDYYLGYVYTIVKNQIDGCANHEDIEEIVSDVFVELMVGVNKFDFSKGSLKTYISIIAKRRAIDFYRKWINKRVKEEYIEKLEEISTTSEGLEEELIREEERKEVFTTIQQLGEPDREIFIRRYYYNQSSRSIGEALAMNENTVDKRISRGIQKLKLLLGGVLNG